MNVTYTTLKEALNSKYSDRVIIEKYPVDGIKEAILVSDICLAIQSEYLLIYYYHKNKASALVLKLSYENFNAFSSIEFINNILKEIEDRISVLPNSELTDCLYK